MSASQSIITISNLVPTQLPISGKLTQCLVNTIDQRCQDGYDLAEQLITASSVTLNFRDQSYSAKAGGFHPVEICLVKQANGNWQYAYITDFAYVGNYYPELAKDLDFDFLSGEWFTYYLNNYSLITGSHAAVELYQLWEQNFLSYFNMDMYDEIQITLS